MDASQIREMVVSLFEEEENPSRSHFINREPTEKVDCFKCLGTIISIDVGWENNTVAVVKRLNKGCTSCAN